MSITAEQRTELERRGFPVTEDGMVRVCGYLVDPRSREWRAYLTEMALAAAILGIHPPGYRLVKEEVAQEWLDARKAVDDLPKGEFAEDHDIEAEEALVARFRTADDALANSLSGKEGEK